MLFLQVKGLIQFIVKLQAKKSVHVCTPNSLLRGAKYRTQKQFCSNTLKRNKLKVYTISEKIDMTCTLLHSGETPKVAKWHTQKLCTRIFNSFSLKLPSCELVGFFIGNTYIITEGRNFKAFLKESYAIVSGSCYLFTAKC